VQLQIFLELEGGWVAKYPLKGVFGASVVNFIRSLKGGSGRGFGAYGSLPLKRQEKLKVPLGTPSKGAFMP